MCFLWLHHACMHVSPARSHCSTARPEPLSLLSVPPRPLPRFPQATFVNSCYTSKSSCPHVLLECVRAEWHALHSAATVPAPLEMESDGQGKAKTA